MKVVFDIRVEVPNVPDSFTNFSGDDVVNAIKELVVDGIEEAVCTVGAVKSIKASTEEEAKYE